MLLTERVPLILPYCLGDVVGEVFGYHSRGVVILDVGAPCNGTCRENKTEDSFFNTETTLTHRSLHKIHADDTQSKAEWRVKITLFHSVMIQPERLCLRLLIKYARHWQITLLLKQQQRAVVLDPIVSILMSTFNIYLYYLQL